VGAQEFGSYFAQRLQAKDYSTTWEGTEHATDPMVICQTIVDDAQNREVTPDLANPKIAGGGVHIVVNRLEAGAPPVSASYPGTQLQTIDSILSTLSQMGYKAGFDYSFDVDYIPGTKTPAVTLNFWFPRQGRENSGVTVTAADCLDWNYDEDSSKQADLVSTTGSGSGGIQPVAAYADPIDYPLLERTVSHTQITSQEVLGKIALGELSLSAFPVTTPQLILPVPIPGPNGKLDPNAFTFTDFLLGDDLTFKIDPVAEGGRNTDPRFPHGMHFTWRITNWTTAVADKGVSTLTFTLNTPPFEMVEGQLPKPPPLH
jgi:hypothetical protein